MAVTLEASKLDVRMGRVVCHLGIAAGIKGNGLMGGGAGVAVHNADVYRGGTMRGVVQVDVEYGAIGHVFCDAWCRSADMDGGYVGSRSRDVGDLNGVAGTGDG